VSIDVFKMASSHSRRSGFQSLYEQAAKSHWGSLSR